MFSKWQFLLTQTGKIIFYHIIKVDSFKNTFNCYFSKFVTLIHDLKWSYLKKKYKMLLIEIKFISYFLSEVAVILCTCKSDDMYIMCTCLIYWVRFYKWYTGYLAIIIFQVTYRNRNTYLFQWFRADRRWGVVYRPSTLTAC